ncbi:MAG: hypothetical protein MJA29_05140 [Candidatus Omnitrophica bacterium]|nr:hypothetical protein [Candidatus Omnitrophota bacterium]
MRLEVLLVSPSEVIFEGELRSLILPGESGVFELMAFHKGITSRLVSGVVFLDDRPLRIRKGVMKARGNRVTIVCEPA